MTCRSRYCHTLPELEFQIVPSSNQRAACGFECDRAIDVRVHRNCRSTSQSGKNFIGVGSRQLLALLVNTVRTLFDRIVTVFTSNARVAGPDAR